MLLARLDERSEQKSRFAKVLQWIVRLLVTAFLAVASWFLNDFSAELRDVKGNIKEVGEESRAHEAKGMEIGVGLRRDVDRLEGHVDWIENGKRGPKPPEKEE